MTLEVRVDQMTGLSVACQLLQCSCNNGLSPQMADAALDMKRHTLGFQRVSAILFIVPSWEVYL